MYIPKISTKRVLGLVMASALAVTGTVVFAGSSEAVVSTVKVKVSPVSGSSGGGTIVTITGKGFQNDVGTSQVGKVTFDLTACTDTPGVLLGAPISVASATKIVVTSPALTVAKYNVCVYNVGNTLLIGSSIFTGVLSVSSLAITPASGPSYGGAKVVISGDDFTAKTTATIGGKAITAGKVVINAGATDDTLTGLIPVGSGLAKDVIVTNEGGDVKLAAAFGYLDAIKVSPAFGDGTAGNVITINGSGFLARNFLPSVLTGINKSVIVLNQDTPLYVVGGAYIDGDGTGAATTGFYCTNIQVESDIALTCQVPAIAAATVGGGYSVQILDSGATGSVIAAVTAVSRSASYTVSAF